jgi:hypothetical protein
MKFLALEKESAGITEEQFTPALLREEAARAWELQQAGVFREMYFRSDRHEAVLVLECASIGDAQKAIDSLPLVRKGLIQFEIAPLVPYDGFARLFEK